MSSQTGPVVAVVDDDPGVRDSLRFLLETAGHDVAVYASGPQFLLRADPSRLACLVLDQQMPDMTGLDLLARLRAQGLATPVLLIVSTPGPAVARRAAELGVAGVIEKPLSQDDLLARIEAAVA
ncbi:response regulator transcription factor [Siccirubricoccus sp. G192]|uniref:response regulator transcription factor n=1 Tax=Siccirubricoccus sp. G192 TaxID=2849651 RepID=UPI001C2B8F31|nr:response regulator [Siccirubricoccus sp. G192]MBV1796655.1 response regulator [Siccirubricoccus sp. G192]